MSRVVIGLLRAMLVVLLIGCLLTQVITPVLARDMTEQLPEARYLVAPYSTAAILAIVCVEIGFIAVWKLLTMAGRDQIFTPRAFRWVDVIIGCTVVATLLAAAVWIYMFLTPHVTAPIMALGMTGIVAIGLALGLLMLVMRGLLKAAVADRVELAGLV